jgi:hypothetical protein
MIIEEDEERRHSVKAEREVAGSIPEKRNKDMESPLCPTKKMKPTRLF